MLTRPTMPHVCGTPRRNQSGVVLMMALIVLVAMTLAGIALVRSVDTSNIIAGNLAFKQAATNSGDVGIETAVAWLEKNNNTNLNGDIYAQAYASNGLAVAQNPAGGKSWDYFWFNTVVLNNQMQYLVQDPTTGNTVAYIIQRLCDSNGVPFSVSPLGVRVNCVQSQSAGSNASSSKTAGTVALLYNSQIYYRITSRIAGPRNTVSYVQVIVAL